ncbi:MAG: TonB-dependent receptor [Bacteroidota bacterium]
MRASLLFLLFLAVPLAAQPTGRVVGQVIDAATESPLPGATVTVVGTSLGAATDLDGRFVLAAVPVGTQALEARFLGYDPLIQTDVVVRSGRQAEIVIGLRESIIEGEAVTVRAGYFASVGDVAPMSAVSFSNEEIRRAPGAAQEISRVLNALPGVASRGETSQDLFVRGGAPAENGFYVDNIPIPVPQHFATPDGASFGPTGLINTELVGDVTFARGAFSAAYGGRLSSVVDIRYRDGATDRVRGTAGLNFAGGLLVAEGPIPNGSFFVSGRRSYLDLVADAINAGGAPTFGDAQAKVAFNLAPEHRISVLGLYGQSEFAQTLDDALEGGEDGFGVTEAAQVTTGANWRALWGRGVSNTSLSFSTYGRDNRFELTRGIGGSFALDSRESSQALRHVTRLSLGGVGQVELGAEGTLEQTRYDNLREAYVAPSGATQPAFEQFLSLDRARAGAFASADLRPVPGLTATLGLRADWDDLSGQVYPQPRVSLGYALAPDVTARAAYGIFRQPVPTYLLTQADGNRDLSQIRADHIVLGVDVLVRPDVLVTVEAFDKQYRQAPALAPDNPLGIPLYPLDARAGFVGSLVSEGRAEARGVEALVQKKFAGGVYGLVSGSYFRSRYRDPEGVWRNRDYDSRTQVSVVGGWKPNARWETSIRWSYLGGRPDTPIDVDASTAADTEIRDVARTNEDRLPAYHSLYLRVDRRFNFRATNLVASVSLWNAYSRANVESRYWNFLNGQVDTSEQFSLLPIVGLSLEF